MASALLVHIIGPKIHAWGTYRQRCLWCGTLLYEGELPPPVKAGTVVEFDPEAKRFTTKLSGMDYPNSCSNLDLEVTR